LALQAGVAKAADDEATQAARFIESVAALNARLGIPTQLDALREAHIPALAAAACAEANANYPVPQVMRQVDAEALLRGLLPERVTVRRAPPKAARKTPRKRPAAAPIP
jgi:alcohol dehydrogenase class IV